MYVWMGKHAQDAPALRPAFLLLFSLPLSLSLSLLWRFPILLCWLMCNFFFAVSRSLDVAIPLSLLFIVRKMCCHLCIFLFPNIIHFNLMLSTFGRGSFFALESEYDTMVYWLWQMSDPILTENIMILPTWCVRARSLFSYVLCI